MPSSICLTTSAAPVSYQIHSFICCCMGTCQCLLVVVVLDATPIILWAGASSFCSPGTATIGPGGAPCMSVPPLNASYVVCIVLCVHVSASSSWINVYCCVVCHMCAVRACQSVPLLPPPGCNTHPWVGCVVVYTRHHDSRTDAPACQCIVLLLLGTTPARGWVRCRFQSLSTATLSQAQAPRQQQRRAAALRRLPGP